MVSHRFSRDLAGVRKRMQDKQTDSQTHIVRTQCTVDAMDTKTQSQS